MTTARMSGYAISPDALQSYYAFAEAETCAIVQVESAAAVERIPEIAAVDGVDGIFIGPLSYEVFWPKPRPQEDRPCTHLELAQPHRGG